MQLVGIQIYNLDIARIIKNQRNGDSMFLVATQFVGTSIEVPLATLVFITMITIVDKLNYMDFIFQVSYIINVIIGVCTYRHSPKYTLVTYRKFRILSRSSLSIATYSYLSHYLTNLMQKICFTISFKSCLYMFRAHVLIIRRSKLHYTASGIITPIGVMIPEAV